MADQARPWNYKRAVFKGKMHVSLEQPFSNDTCSTVKHEHALLAQEVERAAAIIIQNPDVKASEIAAGFPEIRKRCGDDRIQKLIGQAAESERRFSVWRFCIEVLSEVSRYPCDTIKKYLSCKTRQIKQALPGRPPKTQ